MKAPEPTPESLEKAREQTDSGLCDSMLVVEREALTRNIAFMRDEAVREERSDRLKLAEERNQLLGTEYKLRQALCPRCGPEKLEGIPRTCHMHRPRGRFE